MKTIQQIMKTKIILLALVATFTLTLFSSCSEIDCDDEIYPTEECETEDLEDWCETEDVFEN